MSLHIKSIARLGLLHTVTIGSAVLTREFVLWSNTVLYWLDRSLHPLLWDSELERARVTAQDCHDPYISCLIKSTGCSQRPDRAGKSARERAIRCASETLDVISLPCQVRILNKQAHALRHANPGSSLCMLYVSLLSLLLWLLSCGSFPYDILRAISLFRRIAFTCLFLLPFFV